MDVSFTNVLEGARQYFQGLPPAASSSSGGPTPNSYSNQQSDNSTNHEQSRELPNNPAAHYWSQQQHVQSQQQQQHNHQQQSNHQPQNVQQQNHLQQQNVQQQNHLQQQNVQQQNHLQQQNLQQQNQQQPNHQQQNQQSQQQNHQSQQHNHQQQNHQSQQPQNYQPQQQQSHQLQQQQNHQAQHQSQQDQRPASSNTRPSSHPQLSNHYQSGTYQPDQMQHQQPPYQFQRPQSREFQQYQNLTPSTASANDPYHQAYHSYHQAAPQQQLRPTSQHQTSQQPVQNQQQPQRSCYPVQTKPVPGFTPVNSYYKHLYSQPTALQESKPAQQPEQTLQTSQSQQYRTHNLPPIATLSLITYHSTKNTTRDVIVTSNTKTRVTNSYSTVPKTSASCYPTQDEYRNHQAQYSTTARVPSTQSYQYPNYTSQAATTTTSSDSGYVGNAGNVGSVQALPQPQKQQSSASQPTQQYFKSKSPERPPGPVAMKVKRESPLDLSVKTVRTCADSTLDDAESKYYNRANNTSFHNYPTYDGYANSFQRNMRPNVTAPKVEFHPNFNVSAMNQQQNYRRSTKPEERPYQPYYPTVSAPTAAHVNSYITSSQVPKKPEFDAKKSDYPVGHKTGPYYPNPVQDVHKKRAADTAPTVIPSKITKVDTWRQSIDQQIEQRFSSYKQQQAVKQPSKMVNGNNSYAMMQQDQKAYYYPGGHNQTYVPSAAAHQYPNYGAYQPNVQNNAYYQRNVQSTAQVQGQKNNAGGADKRVLSLLRNSLEIKGAKEAQKKLEQEQLSRTLMVDIQQPSTDVTAPLQPKPGFNTRHNVSPFTPTNFPDQNNLNSMYKFHLPKAIDSVNFGSESGKYLDETQLNQTNHINHNGDLDGLAAFLAARIRTKAELKQVGPTQSLQNMIDSKLNENALPPKLAKEKAAVPPRRKLFSRSENDSNVPGRDSLRSSSETSVFDFPDTDSEGEMPVLERHSLEEMRRDRKVCGRPSGSETPIPPSPLDDAFAQACDSFVEQLKSGSGKKRGRRKKIEADVLAQLESVIAVKPEPEEDEVVVKKEPAECLKTDELQKMDECQKTDQPPAETKTNELPPSQESKQTPIKTEVEETTTAPKQVTLMPPRPAKKPSFGDGSHFGPGWEEEVYKYKKSLRMPPSLIQVTRPPLYHRLSTSLPDLDPCPQSPQNVETKPKEQPDSDSESNHSMNIFSNKNYDSEGSSSVASFTNTHKDSSILDKLLEKYGARKKRKYVKRRDETPPKIVPKPDKVVELLPTPLKKDVSCDFRSKTIESFKDVFLNNKESNTITRNQARKIKQQATIKEVFGEDRPASAPPVTCVDVKVKEEVTDPEDSMTLSSLINRKEDTKQALKNKLLSRERKNQQQSTLLKSLIDRKIKSEIDEDEVVDVDEDSRTDCKSETPSIDDGDDRSNSEPKKRSKFRNIRRKFSSGFDYIRKKKKQIKKEVGAVTEKDEAHAQKPKKRVGVPKSSTGSEQDIQKEIKGWVLNKGIGETILHRSARLGYTDITAYCLEKLEYSPSPKDNAGYTPLHEASTRGHLAIAKMLLMYGANVSESARGGIRPLHEAVENGYIEIIRLLLSYGADPMLATYSGMTPLALASEEATIKLLQNHINDVQGKPTLPWYFPGPASCFDSKESGFDILDNEPNSCESHTEEEADNVEFEVSDHILPNLYTLKGEGTGDRWILLQDLSNMLKIKSRDALLRQICPSTSSHSTYYNHKSVLRELKMSDFLEQAHCCQFLNSGEKINTRASKIALVKYTEKVKELLQVESVSVCVR